MTVPPLHIPPILKKPANHRRMDDWNYRSSSTASCVCAVRLKNANTHSDRVRGNTETKFWLLYRGGNNIFYM